MRKLLWWLIAGSTGGPNRARIIITIHDRPSNTHQLSEKLNLNYKTVKHHIKILEENKVIVSEGKKYGEVYFLSDKMLDNYNHFTKIWNEMKKSG